MRVRYASFAIAFLLALGATAAVAVAVRSGAGPQPPAAAPAPTATAAAAAAAATETAAATAVATATPTPGATPAPAPTPTAAAAATATPKRYDRLDATGAVATAGSWAILGADGGVLTAWEDLRGSAAALRVHRNDASGASRAAAWGAVEAGDLIEWRKADDCWVRYLVAGAPAPPASGSARWEFPVERMTYAATGAGCTGAVGASTVLRADEDAPSVVPASGITSPVRHGPYLVYPPGWTGALEPQAFFAPPAPAAAGAGGAGGAGAAATATPHPPAYAADPAEARRLFPYWRDPVLPAGWEFTGAEGGVPNGPPYGHCAMYRNAEGYYGARICAYYNTHRPSRLSARQGDGEVVYEPRVIDGRAALVRYSPQGPAHDRLLSVIVRIFDAETGIEYKVSGYDPSLRGGNPDAAIAIARSLLPAGGAPPAAPPAPKRYDRLDATGAVAAAGSWAILGADGGVLTTWEDLRGGAAALRVHENDASGASRAAAWGAVEAGDLVEWRKAGDCWIRYLVAGAPAPPASGSSRWEFPVERMTYAATGAGCTGAVGAGTVLRADEDAPSVVPASAITSPVRHGPYLVYPSGWTGALEAEAWHPPPASAAGGAGGASGADAAATPVTFGFAEDIAEARRFLYWRDPVLPAGWTFAGAETGTPDSPPYGYNAAYLNERGYAAAEISVRFKTDRPQRRKATHLGGSVVIEPRTIAGRAALVKYSPQGPAHDRLYGVWVWIFDSGTGIEYGVRGWDHTLRGGNPDAAIAIARSLLPGGGGR